MTGTFFACCADANPPQPRTARNGSKPRIFFIAPPNGGTEYRGLKAELERRGSLSLSPETHSAPVLILTSPLNVAYRLLPSAARQLAHLHFHTGVHQAGHWIDLTQLVGDERVEMNA